MSENKEVTIKEKEALSRASGEMTAESIKYVPRVDIVETEEGIVLKADLPGVSQEQLTVNIEDGQLSIAGLVDEVSAQRKPVHLEYGIGGFGRNFKLSNALDASKATATLKDGVLTLPLPKAESLKPRNIAVTAL